VPLSIPFSPSALLMSRTRSNVPSFVAIFTCNWPNGAPTSDGANPSKYGQHCASLIIFAQAPASKFNHGSRWFSAVTQIMAKLLFWSRTPISLNHALPEGISFEYQGSVACMTWGSHSRSALAKAWLRGFDQLMKIGSLGMRRSPVIEGRLSP